MAKPKKHHGWGQRSTQSSSAIDDASAAGSSQATDAAPQSVDQVPSEQLDADRIDTSDDVSPPDGDYTARVVEREVAAELVIEAQSAPTPGAPQPEAQPAQSVLPRAPRRRHVFARVTCHGELRCTGYTSDGELRRSWSNGAIGEFQVADIESLPAAFERL